MGNLISTSRSNEFNILSRRKKNIYDLSGSVATLRLVGTKYEGTLILDHADALLLQEYTVSLQAVGKIGNKIVYPYTVVNRRSVSVARLILGVFDPSYKVEFRDGNPLNLTRANLYAVHKNGAKQKQKANFGITEVTHKSDIQGYKVNLPNKGYKYFGVATCGSPEKALESALSFRRTFEEANKNNVPQQNGLIAPKRIG